MRKLLTAIILILGALLWAAPVTAAMSREQLAAAALTAADLGEGFTSVLSGPADQLGVAAHMAVYIHAPTAANPSLLAVVDVLADASGEEEIDDAAFAAAFTAGFASANQTGITLQPAEAPAIGRNTLRFTAAGEVAGLPLTGEVLVWRQGDVIAAVLVLGNNASSALPYAMQQRDKLLALIGE